MARVGCEPWSGSFRASRAICPAWGTGVSAGCVVFQVQGMEELCEARLVRLVEHGFVHLLHLPPEALACRRIEHGDVLVETGGPVLPFS